MRYFIDIVEQLGDQSEEEDFLVEMDWYEKSAMAVDLKRFVGKNCYIHFTNGAVNRHVDSENRDKMLTINSASSPRERARARRMNGSNRVPKLGINPASGLKASGASSRPTSTHGDPVGVYFYPLDFIYSGTQRIRDGRQFGLSYPFYYVCQIDKSGGGINLGQMDLNGIAILARNNGWAEQWGEFMDKPEQERTDILGYSYKKEKGVGSLFWAFMQRVMGAENLGWNKLLKNVTYIEDPGLGIIHTHEPAQIVALRPSIIRVIQQGETMPPRDPDAPSFRDQKYEWEFAMKSLFKRIRGEFGGTITFKNDHPTIVFKAGTAEFTCAGNYDRGPAIELSYRQGRAVGSTYIDRRHFEEKTIEEIVGGIGTVVARVERRKSDLVFKPSISIEAGFDILTRAFGQKLTNQTTTIFNESSQIDLTAEVAGGTGRIDTLGRLSLRIRPDALQLTGMLEINGKPILTIYSPNHDEFAPDQADEMLRQTAGQLAASLSDRQRAYVGDENRRYNGVFDSLDDFKAFLGWFAVHGGFDFNGALKEALGSEIAQFENSDKADLERQMGWVFGWR